MKKIKKNNIESMKIRTNPKIFFKEEIKNIYSKPKRAWEVIGRINFVSYTYGEKQVDHLEFFLEEEHRGKGIMSIELPKYLKHRKKWGTTRLLAVVKKDNIASIKLLEKNDFVRFQEFEEEFIYLTYLIFTKSDVKKTIDLVKKGFPKNNIINK